MTLLVYAAIAIGAVVFAAATVARVVMYARTPIHLRWELYPLPHERRDRAVHGGSYFEGSEWWRARRRPSLRGELTFMVPEILLLRSLRDANPGLWRRSFPFHAGLYLFMASAAGLVAITGAARLWGHAWLAYTTGRVAVSAVTVMGSAGLGLAIAGALALLRRRAGDETLRAYTTAGDVFNLLFFVAAFGLLGGGYYARPDGAPGALSILLGLLAWDTSVQVPPLLAAGVVTTSALGAYIPLTHMSHFVGKFFTYHAVRWDDAPLGDDRKRAAALASYLAYRPTWGAGHLGATGDRTWADIVATNPADEDSR
jgi:nitrate reductase gamma subunit